MCNLKSLIQNFIAYANWVFRENIISFILQSNSLNLLFVDGVNCVEHMETSCEVDGKQGVGDGDSHKIPEYIPSYIYRGPNSLVSLNLFEKFPSLPQKFLEELESNRSNAISHRSPIFPSGRNPLWRFESGLNPDTKWWVKFKDFCFDNSKLFILPKVETRKTFEIITYPTISNVSNFILGNDQENFYKFVEDWLLFEDCEMSKKYFDSLTNGDKKYSDYKILGSDKNVIGILPPSDFMVLKLNGAAGTGKSTILGKLNQEFEKRGLCTIEYYATANILCDDIKKRLGIVHSKSICSQLMMKLNIDYVSAKQLQEILSTVKQASITTSPIQVSKSRSIRDAIKFQRLQNIGIEVDEGFDDVTLNDLYLKNCGSKIVEESFDIDTFYEKINDLGSWGNLVTKKELNNMNLDFKTFEFLKEKLDGNFEEGSLEGCDEEMINQIFNIPKIEKIFNDEKFSNLKEEYYHLYKKYPIKRPKIVFIDEYTLLSNSLIDLEIEMFKADAFGGVPTLLVFVGDENQIKPLFQVPNADLKFLSKYKTFFLNKQFRIKDETFNNFLTSLNNNENVREKILNYLPDRFGNVNISYEYPLDRLENIFDVPDEKLGHYALENNLFTVCELLMFTFGNPELQFNNCSLAIHIAKSIQNRQNFNQDVGSYVQFQILRFTYRYSKKDEGEEEGGEENEEKFRKRKMSRDEYPFFYPIKYNEYQNNGRIPILPLILGFEYKLLKPLEGSFRNNNNEKIKLARGTRLLLLRITLEYLIMCTKEGLTIKLYSTEFSTNLINTSQMFGFPIQMYASETTFSAQGLTIDKDIYVNLSGFTLNETYVVLSRVSNPERIKQIYFP